MYRRLLAALLACCAVPVAATADVIRVKSGMDYLQAQEAMDRAAYGDTVLVEPGEYKMLYVRNGIHLIGEQGPEKTIFRWTGEVVIANETDSTTVIEGITMDGVKASPGVLVLEHSQARVRNCIIENGAAGIRSIFADPVIENCRVRGCQTGVYLYETDGIVDGLDIQRCRRGIAVVNADPQIVRNTFSGNSLAVSISEHSVPSIGGTLETANRFLRNPGGAIKNTSLVKENGIRKEKLATVQAAFNYWGSDCPSSSLFRGAVVFEPWVDESGTRVLSVCDETEDAAAAEAKPE